MDIESEVVILSRERSRSEQLSEALGEVMSWIRNWEVPFRDDEEWIETEKKIQLLLIEAKGI